MDESHVAAAKRQFPGAEGYADFRKLLERKDLDAVICGTVDHWHTLVAIAAMKAGKDIYCEKPLTLTIDEGKHLVKVQKETGRILQTGTQQRSDVYFRLACDLVRNQRIGKLEKVEVWLPAGLRQGPFSTAPVPKGFDFDFWMGQTAKVDYVPQRTHFSFRYWWEYSGGTMTDWGAHHNDIALWAIDPPEGGPVSVEGKQLVQMIPGGFTAASEYEVRYTYANGVVHECRSTVGSEWHGGVKDAEQAAARHQVHRLERLDLGHAGRDQRQRPAALDGETSRRCPAGLRKPRSHGQLRRRREDPQGDDLPGRGRPSLGQHVPPGRDLDSVGPQVAMGPEERGVRRRCRGELLCRPGNAEAVRLYDGLRRSLFGKFQLQP